MNSPLKTIIVDDELLARENLQVLLQADPEIAIVAQCADGAQAEAAVRAHRPDLMFLDVQMPGLDGFDLLERLGADAPRVVFVTAYDQYAIKAFEVSALDYLLKPFSRRRFTAALDRAKAAVRGGNRHLLEQFNALLASVRPAAAPAAAAAPAEPDPVAESEAGGAWRGRLLFRSDGEIHVLAPDDISWIKAEGDYLKLHCADRPRLVRMPLVKVLQRLDGRHFVRIHRSSVVKLHHVRKVTPALYGEYAVELLDGTRLKVSRTYLPELKGFL